MKCNEYQELIPDFLAGALDPADRGQMAVHMKDCAACRREFEMIKVTWEKLGELPEHEPGPALRENFNIMLETYKHGMNHSVKPGVSFIERLGQFLEAVWPKQPVFQMGIAVVFLIFGLYAGITMRGGEFSREEFTVMQNEIRETRHLVALSLLNRPSAIDRMEGVSMVSRVNGPDDELISALFLTLNSDMNINVRLAAVDKLLLFSDVPEVREGLVESLTTQMSPHVQIALIDVLTELREQSALEVLEQIAESSQILEPVKNRAREGIELIQRGAQNENLI